MVVTIPLTYQQANLRVSCGGSIMCKNKAAALSIVIANRYRNYVGPEKHGRYGYYYHYHPTRNHKGSDSVHIWSYE